MRFCSANFGGTLHEVKNSGTKYADGDRVIPAHECHMRRVSRVICAKMLVKHCLDRHEKFEHTVNCRVADL